MAYLILPPLDGRFVGDIPAQQLAYLLLVVVVVHQVVGWFVFRFQLGFGLLTRLFGRYDLLAWGIVFFLLFFLRPILTIAIGLADSGSLPGPRWLQRLIGTVLLVPVGYTLWSIHTYFGIGRALGGDHFRENYRH